MIPEKFTHALALQSTLMQVSTSGQKAPGNNIKATMKALTDGSDWEVKLTSDYTWRQA